MHSYLFSLFETTREHIHTPLLQVLLRGAIFSPNLVGILGFFMQSSPASTGHLKIRSPKMQGRSPPSPSKKLYNRHSGKVLNSSQYSVCTYSTSCGARTPQKRWSWRQVSGYITPKEDSSTVFLCR